MVPLQCRTVIVSFSALFGMGTMQENHARMSELFKRKKYGLITDQERIEICGNSDKYVYASGFVEGERFQIVAGLRKHNTLIQAIPGEIGTVIEPHKPEGFPDDAVEVYMDGVGGLDARILRRL